MQLIIPAYNEQARLPGTLRALRAHLFAASVTPGAVEVLVVDNASTDSTAELARAADSPMMRVRVVSCPIRGKGAAVRAGVAATTHDLVGFMDADCATDLSALGEAIRLVEHGSDVAIGSRAIAGSVATERHSLVRTVGARAYRGAVRSLVPGVQDTQCGFKVMRGALARTIFSETRTSGFSFDVEVLARAQKAGARVVEFPVHWIDVPGSSFDPVRHGIASFAELARISWLLRSRPATASVRRLPTPAPAAAAGLPRAV